MRGDDSAVTDVQMAGAGGLAGENYAAAGGGGPGEAGLTAEHGVWPYLAGVADENEIVKLGTFADAGFTYGGAVHAGVGLDFHVIFENGGTGLDDFVPCAVLAFGEAETIGSDNGAVLENDAIAYAAEFADDGVGVSEEVVADLRAAIDGNRAVEDGVFADDDVFIHETMRTDVSVCADYCVRGDYGRRVDAGRIRGWFVEEFDSFGEGEIGIAAADEGEKRLAGVASDGDIVVHEDGGCAGGFEERRVTFVGEEGDLAGLSLFEAGDAGDFNVVGGFEAAVEFLGEVRQLHCALLGMEKGE